MAESSFKPQLDWEIGLFLNWDSLQARVNSHYKAWSYKKKKQQKDYGIQEICLERTYS